MEHDTDRDCTNELETQRENARAANGDHDACMVIISGARLGARIAPGRESIVIGRNIDADFQIAERSVSRRHCRVMFEQGCYWIEDLESTNGTFVNEQAIERVPLRDGDHVRIGETTLKFIAAGNIEAGYHSELHESTIRDPLTGLFNRRHAMAVLEKETARAAQQTDYRLSVILFDIDYFKPINDRHGHLAGDRVLVRLSALAQASIRSGDTLARVGGEEFALVLPGTRQEDAVRIAETVCERVEGERFDVGDDRVSITLSGGVAEWRTDMRGPDDLLSAADRNLYRAKHEGRNRVMSPPEKQADIG